LVHKFDAMLARKGWNQVDRRTLSELLCDLAANLIDNEHTDAAQAAELKAVFDRHGEVDFDTENRQSMAEMKNLFETMTGLDLGDEAFESEDALMEHAHLRLQAQMQAQAEPPEAAAQNGSARRKAKGPTAAQRKREQEAQEATQSLREVYRKLVSALHPDRADDEADRVRRTVLMQRVNQAYEARDLLGLFALQLEIEQVDAAHLARATAERARHYNRVLTDQLEELKAETLAREAALCMEFKLHPFERLNPRKLGSVLEREVRELGALLVEAQHDLQGLDQPAYAKRWLKRMREERQAQGDDFPFDLPF
jgi:hypothetical protein